MTSPAAGTTLTGPATLSANAADNVAVDHVDFYVDGIQMETVKSAPYQLLLDSTSLNNGAHTMSARVVDSSGNSKTTAAISVTVNNQTPPAPDTTAPTVSMRSHRAGATLTGMVTLAANASDNVGVYSVGFLLDGTQIANTGTAPYQVSFDSTSLSNGPHTLSARAVDGAGNSKTSAAVTVTVNNLVATGATIAGFGSAAVDPNPTLPCNPKEPACKARLAALASSSKQQTTTRRTTTTTSTKKGSSTASSTGPAGKPKPWSSTLTGSVVRTNGSWWCRGPVNLTLLQVTITAASTQKDAVHLMPECTGRIAKIAITNSRCDGIDGSARNLTIAGGTITLPAKGANIACHQDAIQISGGSNITFSGVTIKGGGHSGFFVNGSNPSPTNIKFVSGYIGRYPGRADGPFDTSATIGDSVNSGVMNSTLCPAKQRPLWVSPTPSTGGPAARGPINSGNKFPSQPC